MISTALVTLEAGSSELSPDLQTSMDLKQSVLRHEHAAIATRLHQQVKLAGCSELSASTMRDEEVKVIDLPQFKPMPGHPQESFGALQDWEGVVVDVNSEILYASLIDITANGQTPEEIAEIPLEEIADDDRHRVVRGAIFRWVIGYLRKASGTKMRGSVIYFRRTASTARASNAVPPLVFERING